MSLEILPGDPMSLGATPVDGGVNFAVFSADAEAIELCLFTDDGATETARLRLPEKTGEIRHGFVPGLRPGAVYGLRAHGPYSPGEGLRFNPSKLLLDPYARKIVGDFRWGPEHYGFALDAPENGEPDTRDNASTMVKAAVVETPPLAGAGPRIPWPRTLVYETHIRGFTMLFPGLSDKERGRFSGLARPAALNYLKSLGVTAVELLPVFAFLDDQRLLEKGLRNYWGYNTLNFFTPHSPYAGPDGMAAFQGFTNALHDAGLEVILDVVFNHTAEGSDLGPTLSFRGLDNRSYYRLSTDNPALYDDISGCGATMDFRTPVVRRLCLDSLRYWAGHGGVDGFRYDIAPAHGLDDVGGFSADAPFFRELENDPVLKNLKHIAEPWHANDGNFEGRFPRGWAEWNGRARDSIRRFWRGDGDTAGDFANALHGSRDTIGRNGRTSWSSITHAACHDGFPAADLVSYECNHNEANGERNQDGVKENHSINYGVEGESDDPCVNTHRLRHIRNFLASVYLSQGTPMLLGGDEFGRSQNGNNNAYAQDNETSWLDWTLATTAGEGLLEFARKLASIRNRYDVFSQENYLTAEAEAGGRAPYVEWLAPSGAPMRDEDWTAPLPGFFAMRLGNTKPAGSPDGHAEDLLLIFNAGDEKGAFKIDAPASWRQILCSHEVNNADTAPDANAVTAPPQSVTVLARQTNASRR